ncbi:MAG: DUF3667 domain-containing protein [Saprospiraceae bacterium]|nr:DUF3667 domain-containing protein [Saprospiraceae bacterium]
MDRNTRYVWYPYRHWWENCCSIILNVDSKLIRTLGALFQPGKLTTAYFNGQHQKYITPIRLLLLVLFFFVPLLSYRISKDMNTKKDSNALEATWETYQLKVKMDSIKQVTVKKFKDSLATTTVLDTFLRLAQLEKDTLFKDSMNLMVDISIQGREIAVKDIFELTPSEIAEKYAEDDFWKRLSSRQFAKVMQAFLAGGTGSIASFAIKQLTPLMLLAIPFFALFLKLLYIRRKRYYIEHLVFMLHINAFLFFLSFIATFE